MRVRKSVMKHEKMLQATLGRGIIEHVFVSHDPLAAARNAVDELAGLDPSVLSAEALSSLVIGIDAVRSDSGPSSCR